MTDVVDKLNEPWLLWLVAGSTVAYTVLRQASESSVAIARLFGPIGQRWREARSRRRDTTAVLDGLRDQVAQQQREIALLRDRSDPDAWTQDLQRQVDALDTAVRDLRRRNQITDAYLVYDEEWHRRDLLRFGTPDYAPAAHKSFLEFEADWLAAKRNRRADAPKD